MSQPVDCLAAAQPVELCGINEASILQMTDITSNHVNTEAAMFNFPGYIYDLVL